MILYCYISHNSALKKHSEIVYDIMHNLKYDHYKIFYGGEDLGIETNLECNDTYEGLPNKIHAVTKYLVESGLTKTYSHFCKVDCTTKLKSLFPILPYDYYGYVCPETDPAIHRRRWHFGKCSPDSSWNSKLYQGNFVPYCAGGFCYVLSSRSVECVSQQLDDPNYDIYEDLYVGQKLLNCGIKPLHINTTKYFKYR